MSKLRQHDDDAGARAFELMVLTAARTSEVLKARWSEFDLEHRWWTIPGERMKGRKDHRVPLSDAALAVLEKQKAIRSNDYVFAGRGSGPAAIHTLDRALKQLGRNDVTVHGFRSTFRDWCAEQTSFSSEVVEMALAHTVGGAVMRAYMRTDQFERRRALTEAWAGYCAGGEVIAFPVEVRSASD